MLDIENKKTFILKILPLRGSSPPLPQTGFTLLEVMVVLVLIGVILSFVTLSIGDGGRAQHLEREAKRLATLLELANQAAIMQVQEIGLVFEENRYAFLMLEDNQWVNLQQDAMLRPRQLPVGMEIVLTIEEGAIALANSENNPHILILSSGEITPFTADFFFTVEDTEQYRVTANLLGETTLEWVDAF